MGGEPGRVDSTLRDGVLNPVSILLRDYTTNHTLLLGMTAAVALYALRVLRHQRPAGAPLEAEAD
jgi:hypothetical protein